MTSLAQQLASRGAPAPRDAPSFVFTARRAAQLTLEDVHQYAEQAWDQLETIDAAFERFRHGILGQEAQRTERELLTADDNASLDATLSHVLRLLSRHMLLKPAAYVVEWLVRRFRVHVYNKDEFILMILPYHGTAHFPLVLELVDLDGSAFTSLDAVKKARNPVPLRAIADALPPMSKHTSSRTLMDLLMGCVNDAYRTSRVWVNFWTQLWIMYLTSQRLNVGEQVAMLSSLTKSLSLVATLPADASSFDYVIGIYCVMGQLVVSYRNLVSNHSVIRALCKGIVGAGLGTSQKTISPLVACLSCVAQVSGAESYDVLMKPSAWERLVKTPGFASSLIETTGAFGTQAFYRMSLDYIASSGVHLLETLRPIVDSAPSREHIGLLLDILGPQIAYTYSTKPDSALLATLVDLKALWPTEYEEFANKTLKHGNDPAMMNLVRIVSVAATTRSADSLADASSSSSSSSSNAFAPWALALGEKSAWPTESWPESERLLAVRSLVDSYASFQDAALLRHLVLARLYDTSPAVIRELYADPRLVLEAVPVPELIKVYDTLLTASDETLLDAHLDMAYSNVYDGASPADKQFILQQLVLGKVQSLGATVIAKVAGSLVRTHPWLHTGDFSSVDAFLTSIAKTMSSFPDAHTFLCEKADDTVCSQIVSAALPQLPTDGAARLADRWLRTWMGTTQANAHSLASILPYCTSEATLGQLFASCEFLGTAAAANTLSVLFKTLGSAEAIAKVLIRAVAADVSFPLWIRIDALKNASQLIPRCQNTDWVLVPLVVLLQDDANPLRAAALDIVTALARRDVASEQGQVIAQINAFHDEFLASGTFFRFLLASLVDESTDKVFKKFVHTATRLILAHLSPSTDSVFIRGRIWHLLAPVKSSTKVDHVLADLNRELAALQERSPSSDLHQLPGPPAEPYGDYIDALLENISPGKHNDILFHTVKIDSTGPNAHILRTKTLAKLVASYEALGSDARFSLVCLVLERSTSAALPEEYLQALRTLALDASTIVAYLEHITDLLSESQDSVVRSTKKQRKASRTAADPALLLSQIETFLENTQLDLAPTQPLLAALLRLLSQIEALNPVRKSYLCQLIMSTISPIVEQLSHTGTWIPDVSISPLLEIMRSSGNPQSARQALLLLAQIGPFVADQLIHNMMPIFTFMGDSVIQRDDAYSLRIVDRTLECIVPALKKQASSADLAHLLVLFTDAATHVPRHRRVNLFIRFIEALGVQDFLAPVLLLLVSRVVPNLTELSTMDSPADLGATLPKRPIPRDALMLPCFVLVHFAQSVKWHAVLQIFQEVTDLLHYSHHLDGDAQVHSLLLETCAMTVGTLSPEATLHLVFAVLSFIRVVLDSNEWIQLDLGSPRATADTCVKCLIALSPWRTVEPPIAALAGATSTLIVQGVPFDALRDVVDLLLAVDMNGTSELSRASVDSLLTLSKSRLAHLSVTDHIALSNEFCRIVPLYGAWIDHEAVSDSSKAMYIGILSSFVAPFKNSNRSRPVSMPPAEQTAYAHLVPSLLKLAPIALSSVLSFVAALCTILGPRIISLLQPIIDLSASAFSQETYRVVSLWTRLVSNVGLFITPPQLTTILSLAPKAAPADWDVFAKVLAVKPPPDLLYDAIAAVLAKDPNVELLHLLSLALQRRKPAQTMPYAGSVFGTLLSLLDADKVPFDVLSPSIVSGTSLSLILKLNESSFQNILLMFIDWASTEPKHLRPFYVVLSTWLTHLEGLVAVHFHYLFDLTLKTLAAPPDASTWTAATQVLAKNLAFAPQTFWTISRLERVSDTTLSQATKPYAQDRAFLDLIVALATALYNREQLLRHLYMSLLRLTRTENTGTKRIAIEALGGLWASLGDAMLPFVPESAPFLAELLDLTEDGLAEPTKGLVSKIEHHLGEDLASYIE